MVAEHAGEGRVAEHVAGEADSARVEGIGERDDRAFRLGADGREGERAAQRLAAAGVDGAGGGADLRVAEAGHLFFAEIDQAPLALQHGEQVERLLVARQAVGAQRHRRGGQGGALFGGGGR